MKEKVQAPELRFDGFTDDWEERKLKELGDIQTGNTPPTSNLDNYSTDGVLWVTPTDIKMLVISDTAKKLSEVGVTKARIAKAGSILVTSIASIGKNTLVTMDAGFNQQINSLTPTPKNDSYFLLTQSEKWSEKMKKTAASATMQIVNKTDFSNISTFVPVHKEEQQKIGLFFKQLDNTITLHQRKLDLLKEQKKGYLQKMFPKNGEKVPELRFAGFADDWEERKAKEMIKTHHFRSYLAEPNDVGNYEVIQQGDKPIAGYANGEPFEYFYDVTLFGDHTVSLFKPTKPFFIATDGVKIISADEFDGRYFYVTLERYKPASQGYKRHFTILKNEDIWFTTNKDEQVKIGTFFKQLDDIITLHQRKLDLLKEQKKGFLQKMFV